MSFEVEVKFRIDDATALVAALHALGAEEGATVLHSDLYLAHPGRDLAATDEAFRLRTAGDDNRLTYKGPKRGGPTKTREEIEIAYEPGPSGLLAMQTLLDRLGFAAVARVEKARRPFRVVRGGRSLEVTIDDAGALGEFAEVEALAAGEADLPSAQAAVLDLASALGLSRVEPRSYLRMTLEAR